MRVDYTWLLRLALVLTIITSLEARRVRVQQVEDEDYYNDPQDDGTHRQVVLVSADDYNGIYGQQPVSRNGQDNYIPSSRASPSRSSYKDTRAQTKEAVNKAPPVQTIRNYNKVNDDGSFTFGYEAADGSFKEETRGTDCVVRGKYGYVDPDGNKREFTYVSGNPCDPNAPKEEDSNERPDDVNEPENIPQNYPTRPIRPLRPVQVTTQKPVTVFHNAYVAEEDDEVEQPEPEQVLRAQPIQPTRHRIIQSRPSYIQQEQPLISRPRIVSSTTPTPTYREESRPLSITPRPVTPAPSRVQPPATTYRPQLLQVAVTPRPALVYTTKQLNVPQRTTHYPSSTPSSIIRDRPGSAALDFVSEYQKFQTDNQISSTPAPILRTTKPTLHGDIQNSNPVYSSELVFDPASGQYKTALYQTLPQTEGDFRVNHQIQPYVHNPAPQLINYRQLQQQSPLYRAASTQAPRASQASQAAYQQQQAEIQFQNSQQLFANQQRARAQQQQQHHQHQQQQRAQAQPLRTEPQQFYYIQPQALQNGLSSGQIDAFLRGHNIQF